MSDRKQRIRTELAASRAYLLSVAEQISPEQAVASTENPAWNIHDLLAHLAVAGAKLPDYHREAALRGLCSRPRAHEPPHARRQARRRQPQGARLHFAAPSARQFPCPWTPSLPNSPPN